MEIVLEIPPPETVIIAFLGEELVFSEKLAVIVPLLFPEEGETVNQLELLSAFQLTFDVIVKLVFPEIAETVWVEVFTESELILGTEVEAD
ncbi:MAG: hypothetical protein IPM32_03305 [Ignavibacteriae bacterium]|nr:hypothetical protein [Ignavibacteriota bacterium]